MITEKPLSLLEKLRNFHISDIYVNPINLSVKLTLTFPSDPSIENVYIELEKIVHIAFSKELEENEDCFFILDIFLEEISDGGSDILSSLNYPLHNTDGSVFSYPLQPLFYFRLEGGLFIEAVCGNCKAYEIVELPFS